MKKKWFQGPVKLPDVRLSQKSPCLRGSSSEEPEERTEETCRYSECPTNAEKTPCLHTMWSVMGWDIQRKLCIGSCKDEIYVRQLHTSQMVSNTQGRKKHCVGRTYSGQPSWLARMFSFPGLYLIVIVTMCSSDHSMACRAKLCSPVLVVSRGYSTVAHQDMWLPHNPRSHRCRGHFFQGVKTFSLNFAHIF